MSYSDLPTLNALLNSTATVLLVMGWTYVRRGDREAHRKCMIAAFGVSTAFLISYLVYHANVGSVRFTGQGWIRPVYFAILITHVILATVILPLVLITLSHALKERFDRHRRIARWTMPLWLYVSITGVIVYLMLYQLPGSTG